ncbi:hypothetical protein SLA2020_032730 [Shorea laevis]
MPPNDLSGHMFMLLTQAKCDELVKRAEALKEENANLRSEVNRIRSDHELLLSENVSLKVRQGELSGPEDLKCGKKD